MAALLPVMDTRLAHRLSLQQRGSSSDAMCMLTTGLASDHDLTGASRRGRWYTGHSGGEKGGAESQKGKLV